MVESLKPSIVNDMAIREFSCKVISAIGAENLSGNYTSLSKHVYSLVGRVERKSMCNKICGA